jgi:hypothetical protein
MTFSVWAEACSFARTHPYREKKAYYLKYFHLLLLLLLCDYIMFIKLYQGFRKIRFFLLLLFRFFKKTVYRENKNNKQESEKKIKVCTKKIKIEKRKKKLYIYTIFFINVDRVLLFRMKIIIIIIISNI